MDAYFAWSLIIFCEGMSLCAVCGGLKIPCPLACLRQLSPPSFLPKGLDRVTVDQFNPHQNTTYCEYMNPLTGDYGPFIEDGKNDTGNYQSQPQLEVCLDPGREQVIPPLNPAPGGV